LCLLIFIALDWFASACTMFLTAELPAVETFQTALQMVFGAKYLPSFRNIFLSTFDNSV
jgi:hypothetical protein